MMNDYDPYNNQLNEQQNEANGTAPETGGYQGYQAPPQPQTAQPVYSYTYTDPQPVRKPKTALTRGGAAVLVIVCLLVSMCFGLGGAYLGVRALRAGGQLSSETTVLYRTVQDENLAANGGSYTTAEIAGAVSNSVVEIKTETVSIDNSWVRNFVVSGAGSGVIISEDGYIVTNNHVISGSQHYTVTLHDGTEYSASLVGTDTENDIAVLKIAATGLTPAVWGDSDKLVVGQAVVAVGNPLGSLGGSVTDGIISGLNRTVNVEGLKMTLLQHSAPVNPGNSGGGLFDAAGNLIGIVNAKSSKESTEGLGFAIPANQALASVEAILKNEVSNPDKPALGVTVLAITDSATASKYGVSRLGVYIGNVNKNSAAEKGGVQMGDYVVSVDGNMIGSNADLTDYLNTCEVGQTIEMVVIREVDGSEKMLTLQITLERYDANNY